ncbi:Polysaccharide biosynthesis protein [Planctomycetes bacterium Poly30]|uniref:Polysaccharide biosynthesis protein n=1 Tax=Saltatorellus ferox TaxID=2528018 RepID=A0A518ES78_9BACT|nr:Polysaccharide biosynthesis protein [Planctomycetes bacterium Poly30]
MLRSISSNWSLNALQIVVFMVLTPFTANAVGNDTYGIWEIIVAASGPLQLLSLGLPMATVRALSSAIAREDGPAATKALGTSLSLTLVLGVVAALLGIVAYGAFTGPLMADPRWDVVTETERHKATIALIVMLANVALGFALKLPYAIFDAHHDFVARNLIMGGGLLAKLGATVALLSWRADLVTLAWVQIGIAALEFLVAMLSSRKRHPLVHFKPQRIEWVEARSLLSFSVFAFLLNMGALLAFRIDALVIGFNAPTADVAIYGYGNKIFDPFISILLAIGMVLMPMAASSASRGDLDDIRAEFQKWSKIAATIVMLIGGYLIVLGPNFLEAWLGDVYSPISGRVLQILMVSFFFFLPIRGVALPVLMGLGHAKVPGYGLLGMGVANLLLSLALVGEYGIMGVAFGTAIPNVVFSIVFLWDACRRLDLSLGEWFRYTFGRLLPITVVASGALALGAQQIPLHGYPRVVAAGVLYSALFVVLALMFVFRGDRFLDTDALMARLMDKLRNRK